MDPHIKSEKRGALGLLTLDRPKALNALTHGMITALPSQLAGVGGAIDVIKAVAIRGAGERAFCAGGDIRAVQQAVMAGSDEGAGLLRDEYRMNALIGAYPKPYIALIHGICMGGGAGLSVHGSYRLADASLDFAMPETAIGFIPDVGSSHFLSRLPDQTGLYLGLTGERIGLGDALAAGLMTHAVSARRFRRGDRRSCRRAMVCEKPSRPLSANPHQVRWRRIAAASPRFSPPLRWKPSWSGWTATAAISLWRLRRPIRTRSPTSSKLVFRQVREAAGLIAQAMPGDGVPPGAARTAGRRFPRRRARRVGGQGSQARNGSPPRWPVSAISIRSLRRWATDELF